MRAAARAFRVAGSEQPCQVRLRLWKYDPAKATQTGPRIRSNGEQNAHADIAWVGTRQGAASSCAPCGAGLDIRHGHHRSEHSQEVESRAAAHRSVGNRFNAGSQNFTAQNSAGHDTARAMAPEVEAAGQAEARNSPEDAGPSPPMLTSVVLSVPEAVLCSEMGVHFSPCGCFMAACVAAQVRMCPRAHAILQAPLYKKPTPAHQPWLVGLLS